MPQVAPAEGALGARIEGIDLARPLSDAAFVTIVRALGASAVMIGRATLYGASAAGDPGARRALEILTDELARTMRLRGARTIAEIDPRIIA